MDGRVVWSLWMADRVVWSLWMADRVNEIRTNQRSNPSVNGWLSCSVSGKKHTQ